MLSVTNPDSGSATEELEVEYESDPLDIGFNSRYLLDIAAQIEGEVAVLKLADPGSPTLMQDKDAKGALYVLMPMRVWKLLSLLGKKRPSYPRQRVSSSRCAHDVERRRYRFIRFAVMTLKLPQLFRRLQVPLTMTASRFIALRSRISAIIARRA